MRRPRILPALSISALLLCVGCAGAVRKHPEFKTRQPHLRTMAVPPPAVEVYKLTFKGDKEMMYDLLPSVKRWMADEMRRTLADRGYAVRPLDLESPPLAERPDLKSSLHAVRELFDKRLSEYRKRWFSDFRAFRYSIGSEINVFADLADSDAIVIARCQGIKKTGGEIAKDIAQTILLAAATLGGAIVIQSPSVTLIQIGVLDGNTGDILWYVDNSLGGLIGCGEVAAFDVAKESHFRCVVRALLSRFPKASPVKRVISQEHLSTTTSLSDTQPMSSIASQP